MAVTMNVDEAAARRAKVLVVARWCFLNFGFGKTTFEDIAKRANLSRTLLYRIFEDKEDLYRAVFVDWLVSRHGVVKDTARGPGTPQERLFAVCRLMVIEPWSEMVGAPMGGKFLEACERIDPESEALHRKVVQDSIAAILRDRASAEVFVLALDGLLTDEPSVKALEERTRLLAARFAPVAASGVKTKGKRQ